MCLDGLCETLCDVLFPRRCPVCGEIVAPRGGLICPGCAGKLDVVRQPVCKKCGREMLDKSAEYCIDCRRRGRSFDGGMALIKYNETARHSMAAIKYKNRREYLDFYAAAIDRRFGAKAAGLCADALVPVPLHRSRRRTRGYNQAEELAARLSRCWRIPLDTRLLIRKKKTLPQRDLGAGERLRNLQQAFAMDPRRKTPVPESVILVDDIYTTGSTMEACCRVLKQAGVRRVYVLSVCIGYER
ncbi:MAG: ComF family protein [Clostridiales bacterium]|nr:ComF family protein [Clostridiales bacterium]